MIKRTIITSSLSLLLITLTFKVAQADIRDIPNSLLQLIPANATYTVIGTITNGINNRPLPNARVSVRNCSTCTPLVTTSNANGYYVFSTSSTTPHISPAMPAMASGFLASVNGYKSKTVFKNPQYKTLAADQYYEMIDIALYPLTASDGDNDGLPTIQEQNMGLNADNADTDGDGITDNRELFGYNWVDYAFLGGSPRQKDMYVEVDYHQYTDAIGNTSGMLDDALQTKLKETYADMPIETPLPDGSSSWGINLHFVHDQALPKSFDCFDGTGAMTGDKSTNNPLLSDTFYKLTVCVGAQDDGDGRGAAQLTSQNLKILSPRTNEDPDDDWTEYAQFVRYRLILHEMGHALGLKHGGEDNINYKPNYPSVMNYSYKWDLNNSPYTLAETEIGYSAGTLPDLDENNLVEYDALPEMSLEEVLFMRQYAGKDYMISFCPGESIICADWNSNRIIDTEPYQMRLRIRSSTQTTIVDFALLSDHNDFRTIGNKLGNPLPGKPK